MKLIKQNFWILKEHDDFSYLRKFEPDIRNGFGEITNSFLKTRNFTKNVWLINVFATQFSMADISFNITRKELENAQIAEVNQLFSVWIYFANMATASVSFKLNANEEKCKQWCQQRFTYQLHVLGIRLTTLQLCFNL